MSRQPLPLALIGCGTIGEQFVAALATLPAARLVLVCDARAERAERLARLAGASATTAPELVWRRADVAAVIIATPTPSHAPLTLAAARAGKHVLVEKPAALSLGDLDAMQRACAAAGVVLLVGQTLRFTVVGRALVEAVRAGDLGQPVLVSWVANTARPWPGGWRAWQTDPARSGGMALHLGIHGLDLALALLGSPPRRVYAQGANLAAPGLAVHDQLHLLVRCANGANALVEVYSSLPGRDNVYQAATIYGTRGQAEWTLQHDGLLLAAGGAQLLRADPTASLRAELEHFVACCQGQAEPAVTPEQARWALAAALAANRSLARGQPVELSEALAEVEP